MGTEAEQLKAKLEKLERALTQLQTQKDEEIQQLRDVAEEAQANLKLEQERSANLERELKSAALEAELDRHKALDALRAEHQRAIEREQNLVEEEKRRAHDWITDLKSGSELERNTLQEKISVLEEKLKTPESKSADPAGTTAHVPPPPPDVGSGERSTESSGASRTPPSDPTPPTDPAAPTDASRGAMDPATASAGDGGATVTDATSSDTLMKSMTELIKAQMQAMTKAASVQSLPPLDRYTGEGSQAEDDGIDRWLERFDERAHLAEWSDEVKLYQLKVHLNKTASHVFRMFSVNEVWLQESSRRSPQKIPSCGHRGTARARVSLQGSGERVCRATWT